MELGEPTANRPRSCERLDLQLPPADRLELVETDRRVADRRPISHTENEERLISRMAESSFRNPSSSSSTSLSLLSRVRASEPAAWERLTRLYGPVVYRWARQAGLQPQDASDVMQDVFQSLTTNIGKFEHQANGGGFRGWLWTIARNKIRDHYRHLKGKAQAAGGTAALDQIHQLPESPPETSTESGSIEIGNLHRRAMELVRGDFEERTWQAFWRTAVEGDAPADVAGDMGISVWAVYKARSRVLGRLRQELDGLNEV